MVSNNLAISLARDGRRVLVLDANYRRPAQHQLFGVTVEPGLIEVLSGSVDFDDAVVRVGTPPVDILPVGHAPDAVPEMYESTAFSELLNSMKRCYDVILIDVSPALLTSDSSLLAKHVDAIIVVVRAMEDMKGMISRMLRQLGGHRADVLGVILNGVKSSAGGYFRKNYKAFSRYRQPGNRAPARRAQSQQTDAQLVEASIDE